MRKLITPLFALVTLLLMAGVAFAQDADGPEPVISQVLGHGIEIIATVLLLLATWAVRKVIIYFEKKTNIDIPAATEKMVADWAGTAMHYAEEKAHQYRKTKKKKMKTSAKIEAALGFGLALAEQHKLPDLAKDKLTAHIEAKLGEWRAE